MCAPADPGILAAITGAKTKLFDSSKLRYSVHNYLLGTHLLVTWSLKGRTMLLAVTGRSGIQDREAAERSSEFTNKD